MEKSSSLMLLRVIAPPIIQFWTLLQEPSNIWMRYAAQSPLPERQEGNRVQAPMIGHTNAKEKVKHINYNYANVDKMIIMNECVGCKARGKQIFPYYRGTNKWYSKGQHGLTTDCVASGDLCLTLNIESFAWIWMGVIDYVSTHEGA